MKPTVLALLTVLTAACLNASHVPRPDHVVVVVMENTDYERLIGSKNAPFINELAREGALLTRFYSRYHPSQPTYLEFFSGSAQGVCTDACLDRKLDAPSLGGRLLAKGITFGGFAETKPDREDRCSYQHLYLRRHCPWTYFNDVPAEASHDSAEFPQDDAGFAQLPVVSFLTPNRINDMHSGPTRDVKIRTGDEWVRKNLSHYVSWAKTHNSLLVLTFDEDGASYLMPLNCRMKIVTKPPRNHIATIFVGGPVRAGSQSIEQYTHLDLLRTIEEMYGLEPLPKSGDARAIAGIWK